LHCKLVKHPPIRGQPSPILGIAPACPQGRLAPSSSDSGTTGSMLFDFYWGYELYPRIGRHFDIKTWVNCRMWVLRWRLLFCCHGCKQPVLTTGRNVCVVQASWGGAALMLKTMLLSYAGA
jgi:hypothetical protein